MVPQDLGQIANDVIRLGALGVAAFEEDWRRPPPLLPPPRHRPDDRFRDRHERRQDQKNPVSPIIQPAPAPASAANGKRDRAPEPMRGQPACA